MFNAFFPRSLWGPWPELPSCFETSVTLELISESSWSTSIAPYLHISANWCWWNYFLDYPKTLDSLKLTHCIPCVEFCVTRISDLTETQKFEFYPNPRTMPAFLLCIYLPKKVTHVTTPGQKKAHLSRTNYLKTIHPCTPILKIPDKPFLASFCFKEILYFIFSFSEALIPKEKKDKVEGRFMPIFFSWKSTYL